MLESYSSKSNRSWKLIFNPKAVGNERDPDQYELKSLPRHELLNYAKIASNIREGLMTRAAEFENSFGA